MLTQTLGAIHAEIAACRLCGAAGYFAQASPIVVNQPAHRARVMLVGQAPASPLRSKNVPFSGQAGRVLFGWLAQAQISEAVFRAGCYFTAITKCYPGPSKSGPGAGDRVPGMRERALCQPFLVRELAVVQPELIITVGRLAMTYFLGPVDFTETIGSIVHKDGHSVLPLPHPSGVSRWNNYPENKLRLSAALIHVQAFRALLLPGGKSE